MPPIRTLAFSLILLMGNPEVFGETNPVLEFDSYQEGLRALEDHLPELAIRRLQTALNEAAKKDPGRTTAEIRLAEALVRAGKAEEALTALENFPEDHDALFWKGHALLSLGQLRKSEQTFALLSDTEDSQQRDQANIARARILASIRDDRELSVLFSELGNSKNPVIVTESQLLHASVLLDKGLLDDCAQLLSGITSEKPAQQNLLTFLQGRHAILQGDYEKAENLLKPLTESSEHLSAELYQSASIAYADALHFLAKDGPGVEFLLQFVEKNQESHYLLACFNKLTEWSRNDDVLKKIVLQKLENWSTPAATSAQDITSATLLPVTPNQAPLTSFSLYHRAQLLAEENDKAAVAQAKSLLARLRLEDSSSSLVPNSLLETSRLHLAEQNKETALSALQALEHVSESPSLQAHAAELAARIQFDNEDYESAAEAFLRMRSHLTEGDLGSETLNSGVTLLLAEKTSSFDKLSQSIDSGELRTALHLERTLFSASNLEESAKEELSAFLQNHGDHPRAPEARIALAELALFKAPEDDALAASMLDKIHPPTLPEPLALRHLLTQLKLAEFTSTNEHWQNAIDSANMYLTARPKAEMKPAVRFKLAEAYYRNNDFSKAQLLFQQVANDESAKAYHEVALFFAARAAIKVTTPEARNEAVALFERVLAIDGKLANDARLKLSQTFLDGGDYDQALEMLAPLAGSNPTKTENLDALLLKAEALRAKGSTESDQQALEIYSACLTRKDLSYAKSNHIHYLKGLALEKLGQPEDALNILYRVVNRENLPEGAPITEWSFYYDCGSKAITLLLTKNAPVAAYALARKVSRSGGPKSGDFAARAKDIQLKHMIMEE